jgi:putative phage-type endonuclease
MTHQTTKAKQLVKRNADGEFYEQRTPLWYSKRSTILTASEIASVLECNVYQSSYELLLKKLNPKIDNLSTQALEWGVKFEPIAEKFYEHLRKEKVFDIGLVIHSMYDWIGASPDGVILSGKLLEIKCPFMRNIGGDIPIYYWIQMQIQMEVCDMDLCDYLECKFYQYTTIEEYDSDNSVDVHSKGIHTDANGLNIYWRLDECSLKTVNRDRKWFVDNLNTLKIFYNKMNYYKELGENGIKTLYSDIKNSNKRCKDSDSFVMSKRPRTMPDISNGDFTDWKFWVSASAVRNYMIDDPILDWLDYYSRAGSAPYIKYSEGNYKYIEESERCESLYSFIETHDFSSDNNAFQSCIMKKGIVFEKNIIEMIKKKFSDEFVEIGSYQHAQSTSKYLETVKHIKDGTPIISQGVLHDYDTRTFGVPDLLVRSDYLNKIFDEEVINSTKVIKSKNHNPWHYRVMEIKFSVLGLCADGKHLRNGNKNMVSNKGQLYIYNKILGKIQGYTPPKSYVLGKKSMYKKGQQVFIGEPFTRPAHINFRETDAFIRTKTGDAVRWIRKMRSDGYKWKLFPPSRKELMPNMCNSSDGNWRVIKNKIADRQNDITQLWMCGIKNREISIKNGVKNWKIHPNITSEDLGVNGDKVVNTLQLIIDFNQNPIVCEPFITPSKLSKKYLIHPRKIKTKLFNWRQTQPLEMFIDFETVSDLISDEFNGSLIFNVGISYIHNEEFKFKGFTADGLTVNDERKLFIDMHNFIHEMAQKCNDGKQPRLWHWSHAERTFYNSTMCRHIELIPAEQLLKNWCDLLKIFKDEPIVVRGALNFSLKSVVKAFSYHGFIGTNYQESSVSNGLDAMVLAYNEYIKCKKNNKKFTDSNVVKDIEKYNEIDCRVLGEILIYLRASH